MSSSLTADFLNPVISAKIEFFQLVWTTGVPATVRSGGNISRLEASPGGTKMHKPRNPEIILVLAGEVSFVVNGDEVVIGAGSLIFIRTSDSYLFKSSGDESVEFIIFSFSLELFLELSEYLKNDFFLKRLTAPVVPPIFKLSVSDCDFLAKRLLMISDGEFGFVEETKIKVKLLIAELYAKYFLEMRNILKERQIPGWLDELCHEMRQPENFCIGLKKMHSICGCTPEYLCKSFRRYLDKTPTEFVNELRINHGARLLRDSEEEIFAIACDLGFKSLSRFYHMFKKQYNISPAKYRKQAMAGS